MCRLRRVKIHKRSTRCSVCAGKQPHNRKVKARPSLEQLEKDSWKRCR